MYQVPVTEYVLGINESHTWDDGNTLDLGEEWIVFESKGAKKLQEHANIVKIYEQKATWATLKDHRRLMIEKKKKNMAKRKRASKHQIDKE